jgi:pantothenate kinase
MTSVTAIAQGLIAASRGHSRYIVAIAGPPGSGKTTIADQLLKHMHAAGETAVIVPMDGFHLDDVILNARGHRARKGAPHTFDAAGFVHLIRRIKAREPDIYIPVFDRNTESSRAGADVIAADTKFILVEGLYLLLQQAPWSDVHALYDDSIFLDVSLAETKQRLMNRWLGFGKSEEDALAWIASNDLPNAETVITQSAPAKQTFTQVQL